MCLCSVLITQKPNEMKRLLFATDFSESCINAFAYVKDLIGLDPIVVDIIHVYDIPVKIATGVPHSAIAGMLDEKKKAAIRRMQELRVQLKKSQQGKMYPIYGVYPSTEIAEAAKESRADLIVTALRQKYSLIDRMMGTVTAHTIQKSVIPVLAIPTGAVFKPIKNVLFPTEMSIYDPISEEEERALEWLYHFSEAVKLLNVHMIHVSENNGKDESLNVVFNNKPFRDIDFTIAHAANVEDGIFEYMEVNNVDLLALYKPNRNIWERIYHSSVTRKLLYQSRLPLLVFS